MLEICDEFRGGSRGGVTSHPPVAAAYFMLLLCVWLKLFRCRFLPLLEPNPGDALNARLLRSLGFPKSPPLKNPRSANGPVRQSMHRPTIYLVGQITSSVPLASPCRYEALGHVPPLDFQQFISMLHFVATKVWMQSLMSHVLRILRTQLLNLVYFSFYCCGVDGPSTRPIAQRTGSALLF